MKRFFIIGATAILVGVGSIFAYYILFTGNTNRFRLTIEVETPDGLKSGSSVIQTWSWESGCWGPIEACGIRSRARGEAVFVDLGHGKNVIGILGWGPNGLDQDKIYGLTRAALAPGQRVAWNDEHKLKGKGDLPPDYVPTLITFADLNDPKTARVVRPDEFEKVFGPGVQFRRASIETTNAWATRSVEQKMPWWSLPDRPAAVARRAWMAGNTTGPSMASETLFLME